MTQLLFSYGTLQLEKVQLESFGRLLKGTKEVLIGFKIEQLKITDKQVLLKSGKQFHPVAIPTNNKNDIINGTLYKISSQELKQADNYEVDDYKKIEATFKSGNKGWVYIKD